MRWTHGLHAVSLGLVLGCSSGEPAGEPNPPDGDASQPDGDAGQADGSSPPPGHVPSGSCAVVAEFSLPLDRLDGEPGLVRMAGGFMATGSMADDEAVRSLRVFSSEHGALHTSWETELQGFPLGASASAPRLVTLLEESSPANPQLLSAQSVEPDGTRGAVHELGSYYARGTMDWGAASSFDGKRALWVSGHVAVDPLHGFLIGPDGARVGSELRLQDTTDRIFECLTVTPTSQGAAVSSAEDTAAGRLWKLREIAADGSIAQAYEVPLSPAACPALVVPSHRGFLAAFSSGELYEIGNGTARVALASLEPFGPGRLLWAGTSGSGSMLLLLGLSNGERVMKEALASGSVGVVQGELPADSELIVTEAGRLFLSRASEGSAPHVYEIACNPELSAQP